MAVAAEIGADIDVVRYLDDPPDAATLRSIVAKLEGPVSALVRREDWATLGITASDVATAAGVVAVLERHPHLMERPVLVTHGRAIIGRPTGRARQLLTG